MSELYVYYKLEDLHAARLREVAARFPQVRLLRKEGAGEPPTWMEIHTGPQAVATEQAMAEALREVIHGQRHVERFKPA